MKCPNCSLENPPSAMRCDCGFNFDTKEPKYIGKPPWNPDYSAYICLAFGPIAGAIVSVKNLKRFGQEREAKRVRNLVILLVPALLVFALYLDLGRIVGLGGNIGFLYWFLRVQKGGFEQWKSSNPSRELANGWYSLCWGGIGLVTLLVLIIIMVAILPE